MLTNIEISNYKCFKDFKLDGLSQINIFSGGNNVGKTALLEALFIENKVVQDDFHGFNFPLSPFIVIAKNRDIDDSKLKNYLEKIEFFATSNNIKIEIEYKTRYFLKEEELKEMRGFSQDYNGFLVSYIDDHLYLTPLADIDTTPFSKNYINSSKPRNKTLVELYSEIQSKGIQHKFLEYLKILDANIAWMEPQVIANELLLRINMDNPQHSLISSELGEGTNRYIEILATLLSNSDGSVFIDEIENGIHYSKLKDIWKAIMEIVQKENIQLFVTTHDEETIEALIKASEELHYENISSIHLFKDKENKIVPIVRKYENFSYGVNRGADMR